MVVQTCSGHNSTRQPALAVLGLAHTPTQIAMDKQETHHSSTPTTQPNGRQPTGAQKNTETHTLSSSPWAHAPGQLLAEQEGAAPLQPPLRNCCGRGALLQSLPRTC